MGDRPSNEVHRNIASIHTERIEQGTMTENNKDVNATIDLPLVKMKVYGNEYTCLCDSGASNSVINEEIFLQLRQLNPKIQHTPTCGMFCTLAVGSRKQRIRGQALIPVELNGKNYEIIFLIIPNLMVNFIIGCTSFLSHRAILNFKQLHMSLEKDGEVYHIPFIVQGNEVIESTDKSQHELSEESFL